MKNKFEISDDGSIFFISDDGTINRLGKIDSQGNIKGKNNKSNRSIGVLWFFLVVAAISIIMLCINQLYMNDEISYYRQEYYSINNKQYDIKSENTRLKNENNKLQNENSSLRSQNSDLSSSIQHYSNQSCITYYTSRVTDLYIYSRCGDNFEKTTCHYYDARGKSFAIYLIKNGYGLTENGFVQMDDLRKN